MATQTDVRRIALALPATEEAPDRFAFSVRATAKGKPKGFAWAWNERVEPKKPRVPNPARDLMIAAEPDKFFTEPHYEGFPAVLVRLDAVSVKELKALIADAWRCQAPAKLRDG